MRHWIVLILFLLGLGTLRVVACGEEDRWCVDDEDCDDGDPCTWDSCIRYDYDPDDWPSHCNVDRRPGCVNYGMEDGAECTFDGLTGICVEGTCDCVGNVCPCSEAGIRAAARAGGSDPYTFDCDGPTRLVTEDTISVSSDVILDGEGNLILDADGRHRVLAIEGPAAVELRGFRVTGGKVADAHGGGISNNGELTLVNSAVRGNVAERAGGLWNGEEGILRLVSSTVSGNTADSEGGGIWNNGELTLVNSAVRGNVAERAGGLWNGREGILRLVSSTVSGNTADSGGGIFQSGATLILINSTVSGNAADEGGGIYSDGSGPSVLINSTVSGNSAERGGAILLTAVGPAASFMMRAAIVDGACREQGEVTWTSNGYNVESPGDTCGLDADGTDMVNVTAEQLNLGPLEDNGGPTMTHALQIEPTASVAIDAIPAEDCLDADGQPLTTDQRGEPRPETGGDACDVGAFERQPDDPAP